MRERGNSILRWLDRWLGIPLTLPASLYRKITTGSAGYGIGIISLGAIGDTLLLSGLIRGIRKQNPNAEIELVTSDSNACAAALIPGISSSFSASMKRPDLFLKHFRRKKYEFLIDSSQWSRIGSLLCAGSKAGTTVGFSTSGQFRSLPYDIKITHNSACHEIDNFLAFGRAIWPGLHAAPALNLPEWKKYADGPVYLHMWPAQGKGRSLKEWPEIYWVRLITYLLAKGKKVALTGSQEDEKNNENFISRYFPNNFYVISLAGKVSLAELGTLFTRAAAVVSVNTGIMHLASLSGAPTAGLHGPTNPNRWGPAGKRSVSLVPHKGVYGYLNLGFEYPKNARPVMQYLPPEDVITALEKLKVL